MNITAIILARNEEKKIESAIRSVGFCDETLVVDDNSTDSTTRKAQKNGSTVLIHPLENDFAAQRNWAMEKAKNDWILFVDADEIVSEQLKNEIVQLNDEDASSAYAIPRRDFFWNTELKHGETKKIREQGIIRLMNKNAGAWKGKVHEEFVPIKPAKKLTGFLDHYSHDAIASFISDINDYSTKRAEVLSAAGKKCSLIELLIFPSFKFVYTYFILRGFLDGPAGFAYSFVMSFHSFLVRAKLLARTYV